MSFLKDKNLWLNIYKPTEISSAKAVSIIKKWTKAKKVGHGGTLDVMADGILPIAINRATKTSNEMMATRKKYFFRIKWGESTASDDVEGEVIASSDKRPKSYEVATVLPSFLGEIEQYPSKFSAIMIDGVRAYELARKGEDFEMKSRNVTVFAIKMLENNQNYADFEAYCSKGTYVRSLARDICQKLGVCGHVVKLTRLAVGDFKIEKAINLRKFKNFCFKSSYKEDLKKKGFIKIVNFPCKK